jgi:hypothetical protein
MTDETKRDTEETPQHEETQESTKLLIDKQSDFKFHAAYMSYSKTWDKISSAEMRNELNDMLESLSRDEMEYTDFYKALDDYRNRSSKHYAFAREKIETQRKRDWRQKQTRKQRNQRHKGRH